VAGSVGRCFLCFLGAAFFLQKIVCHRMGHAVPLAVSSSCPVLPLQQGTAEADGSAGKSAVSATKSTASAVRQEWGALKVVAITAPHKCALDVLSVQGPYLITGSADGVVRGSPPPSPLFQCSANDLHLLCLAECSRRLCCVVFRRGDAITVTLLCNNNAVRTNSGGAAGCATDPCVRLVAQADCMV
jgi:hypothetical protein